MSSDRHTISDTDRIVPSGGHKAAYHAIDADPAALGVRECEHPECTEDDDLQLVERRGGDVVVYCPTHRDRDWRVKIR